MGYPWEKVVFPMARPRKYHVDLTDEEVKKLRSMIRKGATSRSQRRRCQILLDMDEAHGKVLTHKQSARANGVRESTVAKVVLKYANGGVDEAIEYKRDPNSDNARRKVDGRIEAKIIQVACGPVPEGHARWTLDLLAAQMKVELDIPIGRDAIRRTLKKTSFARTVTPIGASRPRRTPSS